MQASVQDIQELRTNFFKKVNENGGESIFHPADINKLNNSDEWIRRFLLHHDLDANEAMKMMWDTLEWRKKFGTNDITEDNIRMEYILDGAFFSHGKDIDGATLFIFKCKKHVRGQKDFEELKRCVVYWFERLEREVNGSPITIFFDLEACGLSNLDMEFTKYLINLFKLYYPYFLNYIIIYEMAWILNAAFKVIKSLLPEKAVSKMKFLNKTTLKDFVTPEQALKCWGGEDEYTFRFLSETREKNNAVMNSPPSNKKVHFADGSPMSEVHGGDGDRDGGEHEILTVNPSSCVTFVQDGSELSTTVVLTNNDDKLSLSYKMKTTSPEKFRVRPSTGILSPGGSQYIVLTLLPGFHLGGLSRDKFLVMSMPLESDDISSQELADMWKSSSSKNITQHKLKCMQTGVELTKNGSAIGSYPADTEHNQLLQLSSNISKLVECQSSLHNEVRSISTLQWVNMSLVLVLAAVVAWIVYSGAHEHQPQECYKKM